MGKTSVLREGNGYIARVLEQRLEKLSDKELARKTGLDRIRSDVGGAPNKSTQEHACRC
jgi:hypothetical protein